MSQRKEIVDNETDSYTMAIFLNQALKRNQSSVDIASGYFNVSGFGCIRESLWEASKRNHNFSLRLLFGKEAISRSSRERLQQQQQEKKEQEKEKEGGGDVIVVDEEELPLNDELFELPIDERSASLVDDLISFLKLDSVQVRRNPQRFNHAKCYILDDAVVVGSSNFTGAGLTKNMELNAALYQPSAQRLVKDWFERRWREAEEAKQELIQILEDSKFGLPLEPFMLYMKLLYEYYRPRLQELQSERGKIVELTKFQEDAVNTALRIIKKFNGVLIADSTGLGKTHIGLELLRELVAVNRKKAILIAPAQVLNAVWEQKLLDASIKTKNITLESTGTSSFIPEDYLDYDVVLIDESHNYRNASTNRRNNLMKLLGGGKRKQVILMTATPVNNSLMDLYYQLSLIGAGDDAHFVDLGIPDLRRHFVSADRKELASGIEDITRLLDELMIRRTRQFIIENYSRAEVNGKPIKFPKRLPPKKVEYSLTELFGGAVYRQVLETIDALHLVPYRVDYYRLTVEKKEREEAEQQATLQKFGLLKRFESSVEAIRKSVDRLVKFYEYFEASIDQGKILKSDTFKKVLRDVEERSSGEEVDDEAIFEALGRASLDPLTQEYNLREMKRDLKEDLKRLSPLKKNLEQMQPYADRKLRALEEQFIKDQTFETGGRKAIVFTQFVDTARYLHRELSKDLKDKKVLILTGETHELQRARILREFAPKSNPTGGFVEREADLLVSTDVLAEGQNLQDANYVVNYDLPWNPMKIVQRVGRVDRLGSDFDTVTSVVFIPEKELEDILGLLEKLQTKIEKARETVGTEATILGEKENPMNFNALSRIRAGDQSLMEDLERAQELLPIETPFQSILSFLKRQGELKLKSIPMGKRSGKKSESNGVVLFYRERNNLEGIHILFYDYSNAKFDKYNDIAWLFKRVECDETEPLVIPLKGFESFRQFKSIDELARRYILTVINAPLDAKDAQRIKPKNQRELANEILNAFTDGRVSKEEALEIYQILIHQNLVAWEDEFQGLLNQYRRDQNIKSLLTSLEQLFQKYKIEARAKEERKILNPSDFEIVCYMFLSNEKFQDLNLDLFERVS